MSIGTDRWARVVGALLAALATAGVVTAWLLQRASDDRQAAVADRVPAVLTTTPAVHPASLPVSRTSAKPASKLLLAPVVPQHLYVPVIHVDTTVKPKPTEMDRDPFLGKVVPSFGVPDDMYTTTWWSSGPRPGSAGMAVILGHTQIGGYGVFNRLASLRPGDAIGVRHGATILRFAVLSVRTGISKRDPRALQTLLAHHPDQARLALLTCSGHFNSAYRASAQNTVVFASLVSVSR